MYVKKFSVNIKILKHLLKTFLIQTVEGIFQAVLKASNNRQRFVHHISIQLLWAHMLSNFPHTASMLSHKPIRAHVITSTYIQTIQEDHIRAHVTTANERITIAILMAFYTQLMGNT